MGSPGLRESPKSPKATKILLKALRRSKEFLIGFVIAALFIVTAIVAVIANLLNFRITPYGPLEQDVGPHLAPPSLSHLFGTDVIGRDLFSRVIVATPNDLGVSFAVVGSAVILGITVGSFAAFKGGLLDEFLMRITDVVFALPTLVLAMVVGVTLGPGLTNMTLALTVLWWPPYARLARGEALKVSHQNFVEAARISGLGSSKIILKHVLPNIAMTMLIYATLDVGTVVLVYSGLSYLGLSVRPPQPDWGEMISSSQEFMLGAPWLAIIPGAVIALGVIGFSLLGDGLNDLFGRI